MLKSCTGPHDSRAAGRLGNNSGHAEKTRSKGHGSTEVPLGTDREHAEVQDYPMCPCGKPATWVYMPGTAVVCDDCVPRGCSCQQEPRDGNHENDDPDNWFDPVDKNGRKIPCVEWQKL